MRFYIALLGAAMVLVTSLSHAGTLAQFRTPLGDIDVELFDHSKPVTVSNFIQYAQSGAYEDMFIHRWVPGFVIQGGGFHTLNRGQTNASLNQITTMPAITNEYGVGRVYSNLYGTIAMARVGGQTNSATSQWFFNLTNNVALDKVDGGFTVFGRVLRGTNVLNRFFAPSNNGLYRVNAGGTLAELPVVNANPSLDDLIYVDISLLSVQVTRRSDGQREISWQSVAEKTNRVEFTTQFPPLWTELVTTNGTGQRIQVADPDPSAGFRFYRVRVDY